MNVQNILNVKNKSDSEVLKISKQINKGFNHSFKYNIDMKDPANYKRLYNEIQKHPTLRNRQLFIYEHKRYIGKVVISIMPWLNQDEIDDMISEVYVRLLNNLDKIDFKKPYYELKSYIGTTTKNHLIRLNVKNQCKKRQHKMFEFFEWNSIEKIPQPEKDMHNFKMNVCEELLRYATRKEYPLLRGYLDGKIYADLSSKNKTTNQNISLIFKRFGKRVRNQYRRLMCEK